jgi:anti-sigma factor RsiW
MCNQEHLISYLYDDLSPADRRSFEAHLAQCAGCREEVAGLRHTRQHLAAWAPPEPAFNFRLVQSARTAPPRRRFAFVPQWALAAAAAVLLMAGAAAIANLEMRYGPDGLVVRTG